MKKLTLIGLTLLIVAGGVAVFSAFEAHVINVTAHIENALNVSTNEIVFGTVFPQEYVEKPFTVSLSSSFLAEERVDDVSYIIKQKPKCKAVEPGVDPLYKPVDYATHLCPEGYSEMLSLCPFLSKTDGDPEDSNDAGVPSYFNGKLLTCTAPLPDYATGRLSKIEQDTSDSWIVDLKVPPVAGYVGQDWPPSCENWVVAEDSQDYGCDLWVEVTGISLPSTTKELACINSGGTVTTSSCCLAVGDFPDTCGIGACGCAPGDSHEVKTCTCPNGYCFDGNSCVAVCTPTTEVCDGQDNDCDGTTDEGCPTASLFFSEYIEGSSNNKALEIYNPTGSTIDLTGYKIEIYANGASTPSNIITISSGNLAFGDVYVVCDNDASAAILTQCDFQSITTFFNGDDAVALKNSSNEILDVIGQIGFDPGTEWGSGLTSTANNTLVRKCNIMQGDTNGSDVFDPAAEWNGYAQDTFSYLGSHTVCP